MEQSEDCIGYWFTDTKTEKRWHFIGLSLRKVENKYYSLCFLIDPEDENMKKKDDWHISEDGFAYFPLDKEILAKYEYDEKLQEAFNKNAESVLNEIFGSKSKGAKSV